MNLAKDSVRTFIFQIAGFSCAIASGMIIARTLGPANRGIIAMTLFYPSLFSTIFNLTLGAIIVHHMGKKEYVAKDYAGSASFMVLVMSVIALIVYFVSIALLRENIYRNIELKYLILAGFAIPFYLMVYFFSSILQSNLDIEGYNISNQLLSFSNLFFILIFVLFGQIEVSEAVLCGISGIVLGGLYAILRVLKASRGVSLKWALIKKIVRDGLKVHIGSMAAFTWMQANLLILNYYASPAEVGFYSVALSIANILMFFSSSLEAGLFPRVARAPVEEAVSLVQAATRQILLITATAACVMALLAKYIVMIYGGASFIPSVTPLIFLLPGVVFFVIHRILGILWVRQGWFLAITLISVSIAVLSLMLNFVLIPKFGASGAAVATSLTYGISSLTGLLLFWRYIGKDFSGLLIPNRQDLIIYRQLFNSILSFGRNKVS